MRSIGKFSAHARLAWQSTWLGRPPCDSIIVSVIALIASVPGLLNDFVYDDVAIIRDNLRVHSLSHWRDILLSPYWPPPFVEQLYRPVSVLLLALQYALGAGSPFVFRVVSCALYLGCSLAVLRFASKLVSPTVATGIAILFAAHPVHVEAVALGVNQGEMIVTLLAVLMATLYLERRRAGALSAGAWVVLAVMYAAATLTKENGFVIPALLAAVEVFLVVPAAGQAHLGKTGWGYALLAVVALAIVVVRTQVLPDAVAVVPHVDLRGLNGGGRMVAMLQVVPTWLRLLTFPATLRVDYHLAQAGWQAVALQVAGALLLVAGVAAGIRYRQHAPPISFGLAWCAIALLPVANIFPTGVLVGERTLFLASVGFLSAAGGAADAWMRTNPDPIARRRLVIACAVLAALGLGKSIVRELSWNSNHVRVVPRRPPA